MTVYLVHFHQPFGHARHYLGWATDDQVARRLDHHRRGSGSNLLRHVANAGITWELARLWPGASRTEERRLKDRGGSGRHCPICDAESHRTAHQRVRAAGYVPLLPPGRSRVHILDDTRPTPRSICGRPAGLWTPLPSFDAATEIRALSTPGCVRCTRPLESRLARG